MNIVFHGENAACFATGFDTLLPSGTRVAVLPDALDSPADRQAYEEADVIVGVRFDAALPRPRNLRLFHVPGAGYDAVDLATMPPGVMVCNCFGHEAAIAEYVMAALLNRQLPLEDADRRLRQGDWAYQSGAVERAHGELFGSRLGILGFGHIGKAVASRARAFGMTVHVANRSPVAIGPLVERGFSLSELPAFCGGVDAVVVTVPLTPETRSLVGRDALAAMLPGAVLINVARGPVVDERALYEALRERRIQAVIDTWYAYPAATGERRLPSDLPFGDLPGLVMTPHMSGWTLGTIRRRQQSMAENIRRRMAGEDCLNVVHGG